MTHTSGPWDYSPQKGSPGHCWTAQVWDSEGESLAVLDSTIDPSEATANAMMMAAAPDLLGAIQGALRISDLWMPGPDCDPEEAKALCLMKKQFDEVVRKATEALTTATEQTPE